MKLWKKSLCLISVALIASCQQQDEVISESKMTKLPSENLIAPVAPKIPYEMSIHGDIRIDNYYWMRDDERKDPKVIAYLEQENEYADKLLAPSSSLKDKIFNEINQRYQKDDSSVPVLVRGYFYYSEFSGDMEYPIYKRRKENSSKEEILLNGNKMAEGHEYFSLGGYSISHNNNLMAYSSDTVSRRIYTIEFKDLVSGDLLTDKLEGTSGQIIWANDNQHVFYIKKDPQTLLGDKVFRHQLGTKQSEDILVYEEDDKTFYTYLGKSKDDSLIYIYHDHTTKTGISYIHANEALAEFQSMYPIEEGHEYGIEKSGEWVYIRTNWQAKNFRIMKAKLSEIHDREKWLEVLAHKPDTYVQGFELLKDYLVILSKRNANTVVQKLHLTLGKLETLKFNDELFVARFTGNTRIDTNTVRIFYSSLTTPISYYDYDLDSGSVTLKKQREVLGDFKPSNYQSERIFITARDKTQVPVSIVYRKDQFKKDGTNPLFQYAYGSYGATMEPFFSESRLSLLDRGFVYAIAHVRGGQELGRDWYEDGKMFNKKNTFNDFVDVTKALLAQKYGDPSRVFASGGSAGGLLIGAVINQAPELYLAVGAHVPFVDVVTTMLDESIPLTTNEFDEWGNPKNKDSYDYMLSYSPYDQVKTQDYPHILVTTGLHDSQVQYFEPAKWVAKLRDLKTDNNQLVFKTNMEAGHGGMSGRFKRNMDRALEYAYFSYLAGIRE